MATANEAVLAQMDEAAETAKGELETLAKKYPDAVVAVGQWFGENYKSAGYKRLAKLIIDLAK